MLTQDVLELRGVLRVQVLSNLLEDPFDFALSKKKHTSLKLSSLLA